MRRAWPRLLRGGSEAHPEAARPDPDSYRERGTPKIFVQREKINQGAENGRLYILRNKNKTLQYIPRRRYMMYNRASVYDLKVN